MRLERLFETLLGVFFPPRLRWVATVLTYVVPAVIDLVAELRQRDDLTGVEKMHVVTLRVASILDEGLDAVPVWGTLLTEDARDRIIIGLAEGALFLARAADYEDEPKRAALRRSLEDAVKGQGIRRRIVL